MPPANRALSIAIGLAALALCCRASTARGPFDFDGKPATRVIVTWGESLPEAIFDDAPMANRLIGVAVVPAPMDLRNLAIASRRAEAVGWPAETRVLGYVHVSRQAEAKSLRVGVTPDGLALFAGVDDQAAESLPVEVCEPILTPLRRYAGSLFVEPPMPPGQTLPFAGEYSHSPILLDAATIRDRLNAGRQTRLPETERFLADEQFFVRLPVGYTHRQPSALLVWVDAGADGKPPPVFDAAADALGLVMIGAGDSGNARLATDRYQLALDAVATATAQFHIDPDRIYVAGISGGGRICSGLAACFPDLFTGAVPIVGVNAYERVPLGDGRFIVAGYRRPDAVRWRLLRTHRIAAISGPLDANYREIVSAIRIFQRDGLDARLFEYEDMAHTLPTAERFLEAITWVDAPAAERRERCWSDAQELLDAYLLRFDALPVQSETQRRLLERITAAGPWSPAAWRACELLGVVGTTDPSQNRTETR